MKKTDISFDDKIYRYPRTDIKKPQSEKSSNINVLLNRIELNKRNENRKKLYFSAIASGGLILFGLIIF